MKKNRSLYALISVLAIMAVVLLFWKYSAPRDAVTVGVLFPMTGDAASYGEKGREAIDLADAKTKSDRRCGGRSIRVVYEDSRADPTTGVAAFRKLINADAAKVVLGDIVSAVTLAVAPIAESNQVLLLSPTSSAPAITNAGQFIFRIWPSDLAEGRAVAEFALKQGYRRASVLHLTNDYGAAIAQIFRKTFEDGGGRVVTTDGYQTENTDFRTSLTRIQNENPDVLYIAGYFADTATILRQAKELGLQLQVLGTTAVEDNKFLELAGNSAEGLIYPLATGFDATSDVPRVQEFVQSFRSSYNHDPGWVEAQAYDAFMLVCDAVASVEEKVTGETLRIVLNSMDAYEGVAGTIRFDDNGDVIKPVVLRTVRNGRFVPLEPSK